MLDKYYYYVYVEYEDDIKDNLYCYKTEDETIKKGDRVLVDRAGLSVGAKVINTNYYLREDAPYPIEYTKNIIKKIDDDFIVDDGHDYESDINTEYKVESIFDYLIDNTLLDDSLSKKMDINMFKSKEASNLNFAPGFEDNNICLKKQKELLKYLKKSLNDLDPIHSVQCALLTNKYFNDHKEYRVLPIIDDIIKYTISGKVTVLPEYIYNYAKEILFNSNNVECVKYGLSLYKLFCYDKNDRIIDILKVFGKCDEFTKYVNFVLENVKNANSIRFELAKKVFGWGRIELIKCIKPTNKKIAKWLITEGYKNRISYSYTSRYILNVVNVYEMLKEKRLSNEETNGIFAMINSLFYEENKKIIKYKNNVKILRFLLDNIDKYSNYINYFKLLFSYLDYYKANNIEPLLIEKIEKALLNEKAKIKYHEDLSKYKQMENKIDNNDKNDKQFNLFDSLIDEQVFTAYVLDGGKEYYNNHMVVNVNKLNNNYIGYIQDPITYRDTIKTSIMCDNKNNILYFQCNCDCEKCEHLYATILYVRNNFEK